MRRVDTANLVDVFFQNRLLVSDDRQRLHRAAREPLSLRPGEFLGERGAPRLGAELIAAGDFDEFDAVMTAFVTIDELGDGFLKYRVREVGTQQIAKFFDREGLVDHEQQRFDAGLHFGQVPILGIGKRGLEFGVIELGVLGFFGQLFCEGFVFGDLARELLGGFFGGEAMNDGTRDGFGVIRVALGDFLLSFSMSS